MITAQQARELKAAEPSAEEVAAIENKIVVAAKEGKESIWHYKKLSPQMERYLKEQGYSVDIQWDEKGEVLINISWAENTQHDKD